MVPEGAAKWCTGVAEWPEGPKYCLTSVLLNARDTKSPKHSRWSTCLCKMFWKIATFVIVFLHAANMGQGPGKSLGCQAFIHPVPTLGSVRPFSDKGGCIRKFVSTVRWILTVLKSKLPENWWENTVLYSLAISCILSLKSLCFSVLLSKTGLVVVSIGATGTKYYLTPRSSGQLIWQGSPGSGGVRGCLLIALLPTTDYIFGQHWADVDYSCSRCWWWQAGVRDDDREGAHLS